MTRICFRLPVLASGLAALLLAGCGDTAGPELPLRIDSIGQAATDRLIAAAVSAGLTMRDSRGEVVPGLAQSWRVSDDGLFIVFRLRAGAQYADGRPVLAQDVVATIARARRAKGLLGEMLRGVSDVSAPLPDVVMLSLTTPQPEILELLATPALAIRPDRGARMLAGPYVQVAQADGEDTSKDETDADPLSGPPTELRANPYFFAAASTGPQAVTIRRASGQVAIGRFQRGDSDMVVGGRLESFSAASAMGTRATFSPERARAALLLLVNQKEGALADGRVRRALSLAVDRETLGQRLFGSAAAVGIPALSPPNLAGSPVRTEWSDVPLASRREDARRLLAEAEVELPLHLPVMISTAPDEERLVSAIAADLAAVGIRLSLVRRGVNGYAEALAKGDFTLALVSRETPIASPLPFLLPFRCKHNRHGVCLPEADALLEDAWKAPSEGERLAAYVAAERLWAEDGAAIGLIQPLSWTLVSARIGGFRANPTGYHPLAPLSILSQREG